jgi:hypothetical protein
MWTDIGQPDRPQMKIWHMRIACWITKATYTHSGYVKTWRKHITTKRKQLDHKLRNLYWITGRRSQLSLENKLLVYKVILKPVWTFGVQLWGTASISNLEILGRFQSKVLRIITDAPRYVPNAVTKRDLQIPTVKQEAPKYSANCRKRLDVHPTA